MSREDRHAACQKLRAGVAQSPNGFPYSAVGARSVARGMAHRERSVTAHRIRLRAMTLASRASGAYSLFPRLAGQSALSRTNGPTFSGSLPR